MAPNGIVVMLLWRYTDAMNLEPYVESIHRQLEVAAEAHGDDARALAERLLAPLDSAMRLTVQDALAAAAEEITLELAPGSVEVRLRGREPEFVVNLPTYESSGEDITDERDFPSNAWRRAGTRPRPVGDGDEATVSRVNLRLPDDLKARAEQAAASQGLSLNAWLVRVVAAAVDRADAGPRGEPRNPQGAQRYTGWAR